MLDGGWLPRPKGSPLPLQYRDDCPIHGYTPIEVDEPISTDKTMVIDSLVRGHEHKVPLAYQKTHWIDRNLPWKAVGMLYVVAAVIWLINLIVFIAQ
jgi:hypothetical protein